jgi:hypothetical protein
MLYQLSYARGACILALSGTPAPFGTGRNDRFPRFPPRFRFPGTTEDDAGKGTT